MIVCGLKLTHDGAVALVENGVLKFSVELEKMNNNARYTAINDTEMIGQILAVNGYDASQVDVFAIDGWGGDDQDALAIQPGLEIGAQHNALESSWNGIPYKLDISRYEENSLQHNVLEASHFTGLRIAGRSYSYESYLHVAGHIMSAYATAPFASRKEDAFVLIWDGGMYPRLYLVDAAAGKVINYGPIFLLIGNIYTIFSQHFGPFKTGGNFAKDNLSIAGKVMAYIAMGKVQESLFAYFDRIYVEEYDKPMGFANVFANKFKEMVKGSHYTDEDILCSFHVWLERLLVQKLRKKIGRTGSNCRNICLAGGCALNIKWNSAVRNSGLFDEVYVPPFPNDSGSAIGAAALAFFHQTGSLALDWQVYTGPHLCVTPTNGGWKSRPCSLEELANILHTTNEPVVFLNGPAETGPRALGNRSILAAPVGEEMKGVLNRIKQRESYRPVSPICLEEYAREIFEPGTPDPYMLFDHKVKPEWLKKIPAVCHLDETARLQTVKPEQNPHIYRLLKAYQSLSGIPMLCNTSANFNGKGFFPDVASAMKWDQTRFIWSNEVLYEKENLTVNGHE